MRADDFGLVGVIRERVGVVTERRNLHAMLFAQAANVVGLRLREAGHVDVADAAVRPIHLGARPAHDFDALVTFAGGEGEDFFERKVTKNGADKTKLHEYSRC